VWEVPDVGLDVAEFVAGVVAWLSPVAVKLVGLAAGLWVIRLGWRSIQRFVH